ncbi:hypothetical protein BDZ89DRAFT_1040032 [Hymenopellis radicata]|nr:hypothetical protein BDZ89DRAFT_1040032 [Hymenopellis radicata]
MAITASFPSSSAAIALSRRAVSADESVRSSFHGARASFDDGWIRTLVLHRIQAKGCTATMGSGWLGYPRQRKRWLPEAWALSEPRREVGSRRRRQLVAEFECADRVPGDFARAIGTHPLRSSRTSLADFYEQKQAEEMNSRRKTCFTMSSKSALPPAQINWFKPIIEQFLAKLSVNKPVVVGLPPPGDDPDIKEWVANRKAEWEDKYHESSIAAGLDMTALRKVSTFLTSFQRFAEMSQAVSNLFRNHRNRATTAALERGKTAELEAQRRSLEEERQRIGEERQRLEQEQKLFQEERRRFQEQEKPQASTEDGSQHSLGFQAQYPSETTQNNLSPNISYSNQLRFQEAFSDFLKDKQLGNAAFHLLYAFRSEQEELITGVVHIPAPDTSPPAWFPHLAKDLSNSWIEFAQQTIAKNRVPLTDAQKSFSCDAKGCPSFTASSSTMNFDMIPPAELRAYLSLYLQAQWDCTRTQIAAPHDNATWPVDIPWSTIVCSPAIPDSSKIGNPTHLEPQALYDQVDLFNKLPKGLSRASTSSLSNAEYLAEDESRSRNSWRSDQMFSEPVSIRPAKVDKRSLSLMSENERQQSSSREPVTKRVKLSNAPPPPTQSSTQCRRSTRRSTRKTTEKTTCDKLAEGSSTTHTKGKGQSKFYFYVPQAEFEERNIFAFDSHVKG